ncbi:MAG: trehalose-phosphatase [bacterium]
MNSFDLIESKIKYKEKILLMFDYDGTLTPIVDKPELAVLDKKVKNSLEKIASTDFINVSIITGRQVIVIKELSGINSDNVNIYGLHGGEMKLGTEIINNTFSLKNNNLELFKNSLKEKLNNYNGIFIEDKEYTISLHYRLANEKDSLTAVELFKTQADFYNLHEDFRYQNGKKVIEILPKKFSKNNAVASQIANCPEYFPVFFGDDLTDISAFEEVKRHNGMAIGVGNIEFSGIDDYIEVEELGLFIQRINTIINN